MGKIHKIERDLKNLLEFTDDIRRLARMVEEIKNRTNEMIDWINEQKIKNDMDSQYQLCPFTPTGNPNHYGTIGEWKDFGDNHLFEKFCKKHGIEKSTQISVYYERGIYYIKVNHIDH